MLDLNSTDIKAFISECDIFGQRLNMSLHEVRDDDVLAECMNGLRLSSPRMVAHLLMENIRNSLASDLNTLPAEDKIFWTEVAAVMGPDWIERFRMLGAFMQYVDNFQPRKG